MRMPPGTSKAAILTERRTIQLPRFCENCGYREQGFCYLKCKNTADDDSCPRLELKGMPIPFTDPLPDSYVSDGDGWE